MMQLVPFNGPVWRLLPDRLVAMPDAPAGAPEGRFHHGGQPAAYASLSPEGTRVAIRRYLGDETPRILVSMWLDAKKFADARGDPAASVVWQDDRDRGEMPQTWAISDTARRSGAQAMLYLSRSRPDLTHVVAFDLSCLTYVGPATAFVP